MRGGSLPLTKAMLQSEEVLQGTRVLAGNCMPTWKGR